MAASSDGRASLTRHRFRELIQVLDLESHFLRFEGERVLILGCHDLNMFSPRAWSNQLPGGERRKRCRAMRSNASKFRPTIVLQHPHSTDSERIWLMPWKWLTKNYRSINDWASGICFYRDDGVRSTLAKVAAATRSAKGGLDFVFRLRRGEPIGPKLLHPSRRDRIGFVVGRRPQARRSLHYRGNVKYGNRALEDHGTGANLHSGGRSP